MGRNVWRPSGAFPQVQVNSIGPRGGGGEMERRRTIVLSTVCAATLFASISCGGKNPTDPTKGATNAPIAGAGGDEVTAQSTSSMRWSLADRCPDGRGLQWRLFDVVNNQHFPASGRYVTPNGGSKTA